VVLADLRGQFLKNSTMTEWRPVAQLLLPQMHHFVRHRFEKTVRVAD
jgi:hypothetical protein